jgi:hypothetical protein
MAKWIAVLFEQIVKAVEARHGVSKRDVAALLIEIGGG